MGGGEKFWTSIFSESLGKKLEHLKVFCTNKMIRESYKDFRSAPPPPYQVSNEASLNMWVADHRIRRMCENKIDLSHTFCSKRKNLIISRCLLQKVNQWLSETHKSFSITFYKTPKIAVLMYFWWVPDPDYLDSYLWCFT